MNVTPLPLSPADVERWERREAERADRLRRARLADRELAAYAKATQARQRPRWQSLLDFGPEWAL